MCNILLIVLNYNDFETTIKFLKNVEGFERIDKIVVVDNNSTDNSFEELLKYESDKIDVIKNNQNLGYAHGNNFGMKYAQQKYNPTYFIIANPDISFEENTIYVMEQELKKNSKIALVAPKMISINFPNELTAWKLPSLLQNITSNFIIFTKIFGNSLRYLNIDKERTQEVEVLPGSFFMVEKVKMQEVDYFDDRTFLYFEENILAYKLKEKGYSNILINDVNYMHEHSKSIDKNINSILKKYSILHKSKFIYNKYYLKKSFFSLIISECIFYISQLEKILITLIRRGKKNVQ